MSTREERSPSGRHHVSRWIDRPTLQDWGHRGGAGGNHRAPEDTHIVARIARIQVENGGPMWL